MISEILYCVAVSFVLIILKTITTIYEIFPYRNFIYISQSSLIFGWKKQNPCKNPGIRNNTKVLLITKKQCIILCFLLKTFFFKFSIQQIVLTLFNTTINFCSVSYLNFEKPLTEHNNPENQNLSNFSKKKNFLHVFHVPQFSFHVFYFFVFLRQIDNFCT